MADIERAPLLLRNESGTGPSKPHDEPPRPTDTKSVDDAVVPEASILGRRIGWMSAYILVISRVVGSGIFAMPGVIIQNVGSPGLQ